MNRLFAAAREVCDFMAGRKWGFCIIGGLAVQQWGEPRTTLDVDVTLMAGLGHEEPLVAALLEAFRPRIADARDFALTRRVLLVTASNGVDIDIALGALPFEDDMVRRARMLEFAPGVTMPCCTPEDLIVMKVFAGRPRDWLDAESVVARRPGLDKEYILGQLRLLCELRDSPEILERAGRLLGTGT